jgi:hypothetical protein
MHVSFWECIFTQQKNHVHLFLALPQCSCSVFVEKLEEKQSKKRVRIRKRRGGGIKGKVRVLFLGDKCVTEFVFNL